MRILWVGGNPTPTGSSTLYINHLTGLGHTVDFQQGLPTVPDAYHDDVPLGYHVVLLSNTQTSTPSTAGSFLGGVVSMRSNPNPAWSRNTSSSSIASSIDNVLDAVDARLTDSPATTQTAGQVQLTDTGINTGVGCNPQTDFAGSSGLHVVLAPTGDTTRSRFEWAERFSVSYNGSTRFPGRRARLVLPSISSTADITTDGWALFDKVLVWAGFEFPPPNVAPVASAGPDQTVTTNQLVTLTAAASTDSDSGPGPLAFTWTQLLGPTVALSDPAASAPTFTAPNSISTLRFQVSVDDGDLSSTDTVDITVQAPLVQLWTGGEIVSCGVQLWDGAQLI